MTESPLLSIVIAVLNNAATLGRCIESVLAQDYKNRELIVIDGGSTDGSLEIVREHASKLAYWESKPDRGVYHAFNKGLQKASGEWIYFLGSDDYLWDRRVTDRMSMHLAGAYPTYRVVYSQVCFVTPQGETLEVLGRPWKECRRWFRQGFMIPHQAVFHHRSLFDVHGPFDETFRLAGDYELLLRELAKREALFVPGIIVAAYQFGGSGSLPDNSLRVLKERRLAHVLNGIRFPGFLWYAMIRTLIRIALWKMLGERTTRRVLDWGRAVLGKPPFWTRI